MFSPFFLKMRNFNKPFQAVLLKRGRNGAYSLFDTSAKRVTLINLSIPLFSKKMKSAAEVSYKIRYRKDADIPGRPSMSMGTPGRSV